MAANWTLAVCGATQLQRSKHHIIVDGTHSFRVYDISKLNVTCDGPTGNYFLVFCYKGGNEFHEIMLEHCRDADQAQMIMAHLVDMLETPPDDK